MNFEVSMTDHVSSYIYVITIYHKNIVAIEYSFTATVIMMTYRNDVYITGHVVLILQSRDMIEYTFIISHCYSFSIACQMYTLNYGMSLHYCRSRQSLIILPYCCVSTIIKTSFAVIKIACNKQSCQMFFKCCKSCAVSFFNDFMIQLEIYIEVRGQQLLFYQIKQMHAWINLQLCLI